MMWFNKALEINPEFKPAQNGIVAATQSLQEGAVKGGKISQ
jgi:hypothetical protein